MVNYSFRRLRIESAWNIPPGCGKGEQSKQQQQQRESLCHAAADQRHPDSVHQLELCFRSCRFPSLSGGPSRWHILGHANTLHSGTDWFFDWSALKMTQCRTLRKFRHFELFWRDWLCNLTLKSFLGRTSQKTTLYEWVYFDIVLNYHLFTFRLLQYLRALFSPIHRWKIIWCCYSRRCWKFRWEHMWPTELQLWEEWEEWISQEQAMGVSGELKETPRWKIRMS